MITTEKLFKCNNCNYKNTQNDETGYLIPYDDKIMFVPDKGHSNYIILKKDLYDDTIDNLEIIPRDPLLYNDWKVGDRVVFKNDHERTGEVIFLSGNYIVISDENQDAIGYDVRKFNKYFELDLTDVEKEILYNAGEFNEEDIVIYKRFPDDPWKLGYVHDTYKRMPTVKHIMQVRDGATGAVHIIRREQIQPFNKETKEMLNKF